MLSLQIILTEKSFIIKWFSLKIGYKQNQDTEVHWKIFTSKEEKRRLGECRIVLIFFGQDVKMRSKRSEAKNWLSNKNVNLCFLDSVINWNKRCDRLATHVFLFSAKNRIYKQTTHTHTQSRAENSLFHFWLTITKAFSPFYHEETTSYGSLSARWAYGLVNSRNNLTRIN